LYRLGLGGACKALSILALQVFVPLILLFIALAIKSGTLVIVSIVLYASNAIGIFFHAWLRTYVRELYSIPGTHSDDALHAIFCWACSLAQLERETSGLNRTEISTLQGNNNGNSKDVPIIPESVSVSVPSIPATVIVTPSAPVHV
jgi:Cys-rich protein (TIGR01571 family)